ncbi:mitochondrial inner membrane protein COX18 [Fopius arisanus]|uniref:Mitochondrial inner membrane protein COX18 n=1 Tax=Fopius arisanus TaxID=64838 RepID=A0A9R1TIF9_9HYME|nr:PREDICTED: mitochondrial inner membrane protein COX18 [Fopius arisanus]XP_011309767.1 PREDICTED: mitochondrial inner membrane protein COX18 [Fopius arisanus]
MWKIMRTKGELGHHMQFVLNSVEMRQKTLQCFNSNFHSQIHRENLSLFSLQCLQCDKSFNLDRFSGGIGSSGLFRRNRIRLLCQSVRHLSDLPTDLEPLLHRYEGIPKILVDSPPIEFMQNHLITLHSTLGLPWWATIVLVTCTAKTLLTLPSALYQHYILAKLANLKWEMDEIVHDLKREASYRVQELGYTENESRVLYNKAFRDKWNELIVKENCHPMKGFVLIMTQLPLWICLSAAIRNLCYMLPYPTPLAQRTLTELSHEGIVWFSNLAVADPYFILPITMGVCNLINIEFNYMMRVQKPTRIQRITLNVFRGISVILVPIASIVPSGMSLYWAISSVFGLLQNIFIVSPRVRRFFRIEETEHELQRPYKHVLNRVRAQVPLKTIQWAKSSGEMSKKSSPK